MFKSVNRLVVDIETLGVNPHAPVLSIGIALLRDDYTIRSNEVLEFGIDLKAYEHSDSVFIADQSTLDWWDKQEGSKAYKQAFSGQLSIETACQSVREFYIKHKCREIWANHPHFDIVILEHLFQQCKVETPWRYYEVYDVATLVKPFLTDNKKKEFKTGLVEHIGYHDAWYEAKCLQWLLPQLQLSDPVEILY